jgi:predicted ATP-dependent serine protease
MFFLFPIGILCSGAIANFVYDIFSGGFIPSVPLTKKDIMDNVKEKTVNQMNQSVDLPMQKPDESKETGKVDIMDEPYLLFDRFIHRGEIVCLFSDEGVGKTLLAIFIASILFPKKVVYFNLDDTGVNQKRRFLSVPSINCITSEEFDEYMSVMETFAAEECQNQALQDWIYKKANFLIDYKWFKDRSRKLMKELGIHDQDKINSLLVFELFAKSERCADAEVVILDSLTGLFGDDIDYKREYQKKINQPFRDRGQTFLILHHTNKKGEISGRRTLARVMDTVLRLDKSVNGEDYRKITVIKDRYPQGAKECTVRMVPEGPQTVRFEVCEDPSPATNLKYLTSLEREIVQEMNGKDTMATEDLFQALKKKGKTKSKGSLENYLKKLEDKGYVKKTNGKDWSSITNLMENDTAL